MNYTQKYHLPQWEESDRILRSDFNQMCADIESGLDSHSKQINQVKGEAAAAMAHKDYIAGSYTGNGGNLSIHLGFRPSFVIITGETLSTGTTLELAGYSGMSAGNILSQSISFTDTGFTVHKTAMIDASNSYPMLNATGKIYDYIAFA